jgi:hypothetical protein
LTQINTISYNNNDDENSSSSANFRLVDQVKQLKMQEFLHLLSRVLTNVKIMLARTKSIINCILNVIDSVAGIKSASTSQDLNYFGQRRQLDSTSSNNSNGKELLSKAIHNKLETALNDLIGNSVDYAQERLVNLLEGKFKENNGLEKLSLNDFISLTNLIDQFTIDFDSLANKKTCSLRLWTHTQANKFLQKFHLERKEKLLLALENERWKQSEVTADFKMLVDHIISNGIGTQGGKKFESKVKNASDFIVVNNEKYVVFSAVIVLIKLMSEYSQFSVDMPNLSFDVMTRVVENFKVNHIE